MERKDNNWVSNLLEDVSVWLTDCVYISSWQLKGKFELKETRAKLISACFAWMSDVDENKRNDEKGIREAAGEIVELLDNGMIDFFKDKISTNFYFVSLRMHQNQIEEKMYSYLCA